MWVMYEEQHRLNAGTCCCHLIPDNIFHNPTPGVFQQLVECIGKYLACLGNVSRLKTSCSGRAGTCTGGCSVKIGFPCVAQWEWVTGRALSSSHKRLQALQICQWRTLLLGLHRISVTLSLGRTGILERICSCFLSLGQGERAEEQQCLAYTNEFKILGLF